jgi:ATP-dependent RNA helicase RhlE
MPFSKLHLSQPILRALAAQGYTEPTPIQAQAIPVVLSGRDVLGIAQTGTGKTAAFALPILEKLLQTLPDKTQRGPRHAQVLVLSPTRELAGQIGESFGTYGLETGLSHAVIFGGVSQFHQVRAIHHGVDVLIATPGRLIDLMEQRHVHLSHIKVLVLDEADRMLDMGFIQPIRQIAAATPAKRQTLLFSATMPAAVAKLAATLLRDPVRVAVSPVSSAAPKIEQSLYFLPRGDKQALLTHFLRDPAATRVLVFTKTKHGADRVGRRLIRAGIRAEMIHGNKAQNQRVRALDKFREGRAQVLVATDVAARGLDVDGITHVINMDLPMDPEAYVHRIGRTGRAGAKGIAIAFCDHEERGLLRDIERLLGGPIPPRPLPEFERLAPEPAGPGAGERRREEHPRGGRGSRGASPRNSGGGARPHGPSGSSRGSSRGEHQPPARPKHGEPRPRSSEGGHAPKPSTPAGFRSHRGPNRMNKGRR